MPAPPPPIRTARERLKDQLFNYVAKNPGTTANKLDGLSGKARQFKATKEEIRAAMKMLQDDGRVVLKPVTKEGRATLRLPHQVKQVYACR